LKGERRYITNKKDVLQHKPERRGASWRHGKGGAGGEGGWRKSKTLALTPKSRERQEARKRKGHQELTTALSGGEKKHGLGEKRRITRAFFEKSRRSSSRHAEVGQKKKKNKESTDLREKI